MTLSQALTPPVLTPSRVRLAYTIGVTTDVVQFLLGPLGWAGADEIYVPKIGLADGLIKMLYMEAKK